MKLIITENQLDTLYDIFTDMMSEYAKLHEIERAYDFWDYKKNSYVDYTPLNYYEELDDDLWEEDDWVFQYAPGEPYTYNINENYPLLIYVRNRFSFIKNMFGDKFEMLLKKWFKDVYNRDVRKIVDDHEGYELLGIYN